MPTEILYSYRIGKSNEAQKVSPLKFFTTVVIALMWCKIMPEEIH